MLMAELCHKKVYVNFLTCWLKFLYSGDSVKYGVGVTLKL